MRLWLGVAGLAVGVILGIALGFALDDDVTIDGEEGRESGRVPQSCLDAISAARDRLLLNPDVAQTLREYRDVAQDVSEAVGDLRLPDLRETLSKFNDLNDRSGELIDRSVDAAFSANARECEDAAGEVATPSP